MTRREKKGEQCRKVLTVDTVCQRPRSRQHERPDGRPAEKYREKMGRDTHS